MTSESSINDRFYNVLGSGIPNVGKYYFTNGFLDLLGWSKGVGGMVIPWILRIGVLLTVSGRGGKKE